MIYLGVDDLKIGKRGDSISTILGSCISLILFDNITGNFGLNHYAFYKTGEILNKELLERLKKDNNLQAIIIGGANQFSKDLGAGKSNYELALKFVRDNKITLIKQNIGGSQGRRVIVTMKEEIEVKMKFLNELVFSDYIEET